MFCPIFENAVLMLKTPRNQRIQVGHEALPAFAKTIFHPRRHFREHLTADNTVIFKFSQR